MMQKLLVFNFNNFSEKEMLAKLTDAVCYSVDGKIGMLFLA